MTRPGQFHSAQVQDDALKHAWSHVLAHNGQVRDSGTQIRTSVYQPQADDKMADEATRCAVSAIPLRKMDGGPRDRELWVQRLREEYVALIRYVEANKAADTDWFRLESDPEGTRWTGTCWYVQELLRYEFSVQLEVPATYPATAPEEAVPELDGKTAKMYRGGRICLTDPPSAGAS